MSQTTENNNGNGNDQNTTSCTQRVRGHFERNWKTYVTGIGCAAVAAGATWWFLHDDSGSGTETAVAAAEGFAALL